MRASAEERDTPAWKIFNKPYNVQVQNKFLYSEEHIRTRGVFGATEKETQQHMNEFRDTVLTIERMAELKNIGAAILFPYPAQTVEIYNTITAHFRNWHRIAMSGRYDASPPATDLFVLDEIANDLHLFVMGERLKIYNRQGGNTYGRAFFGGDDQGRKTLTDMPAYRSIIPAIINLTGAGYGDQSFGFEN